MRGLVLVLVGALALILGPALSLSQQDRPGGESGGKSKGNKSKGGKSGPPPSFGGGESKKSKGGPPRSDSDRPSPGSASTPLGGTVPRAMSAVPPSPSEGRGRGTPTGGDFGGKTSFSPGGRTPTDPVAVAGSWFRRLDQDGDGVLNNEELDEALRAERGLWDLNSDGFIDQGEYLEFFQARYRQWQEENGEEAVPEIAEPNSGRRMLLGPGFSRATAPADGRPIVYQVGNLPRDLPSWFQELDADRDGQVGFYEWRRKNPNLTEFQQHDQNSDGFITVEELLRAKALENQRTRVVADARGLGVAGFGMPNWQGMTGGPGSRGGPPGGRDGPQAGRDGQGGFGDRAGSPSKGVPSKGGPGGPREGGGFGGPGRGPGGPGGGMPKGPGKGR